MPNSIQIGEFVLGALCFLIAILGGNFKLFGAEVATSVPNPRLRFLAFVIGALFLVMAIYPNPSIETNYPHPPVSPSLSPSSSSTITPDHSSRTPQSRTFSQLTLGEWRGESMTLSGIRNPMSLLITKVTGTSFVGEMRTPLSSSRNPNVIEGKVVNDFGNVAQQSHWKFIEGFDTDKSGVWLVFIITSGFDMDGRDYFAHLKPDGTMEGVVFSPYNQITPESSFNLANVP
jgi:hypothetical protein